MTNGAVDVRFYFGGLHALIVEGGALERDILVQVLSGFNVKKVSKYATTEEAITHLESKRADLLIVGTSTGEMDVYAFIRCSANHPARNSGPSR